MAKKRAKRAASCKCPPNAKMVSTKGHGRGFVCIREAPKTSIRHGLTYVSHPFVKAVGCGPSKSKSKKRSKKRGRK